MLHSVLGGHKRQLDVMFCSPAHCGTQDKCTGGPARFPEMLWLCDIPSGEWDMLQNEPLTSNGLGRWVLSLELHQFHTNPKYPNYLCCFKGLLFPDK